MADPQAFLDYLIRTKTRLLGGMYPNSPGHCIAELDNFLRMRHLGEVDVRRHYLAVYPRTPGDNSVPAHIAATCPDVFNPTAGIQIIIDDDMYLTALEIEALYPEMVVDVGLSHLRVALHDARSRKESHFTTLGYLPRRMSWLITHQHLADLTLEYYRRLAESRDYCPWARISEPSPELQQLVGNGIEKLALIHHKGSLSNSGTVVEPAALHPTLAYLRDMGYTILKIGLEPFPPEWSHYGVIPYVSSGLINYGHDLMLIKAAKFAMYNASGFSHASDIIGTPMVTYAGWHLNFVPTSQNCVHLPTLMRLKRNRRILRFSEQINYLSNSIEIWEGPPLFPQADYEEVTPTPELLLASAQEAIALGNTATPPSPEQVRFNELSRRRYYAYTQSRICQKLLDEYPEALESGFDA
jgi:putative glycosyltransferase (TIGR04372 family)